MQNFMGTRAAVRRFEEVEEVETRRLLLRILDRPDKFMDHIRMFASFLLNLSLYSDLRLLSFPLSKISRLSYFKDMLRLHQSTRRHRLSHRPHR